MNRLHITFLLLSILCCAPILKAEDASETPAPTVVSTTISLNGYDRKVDLLLPPGYEESEAIYPVVYYVGVKQRYSNSGDDSNFGDDLFDENSWDMPRKLMSEPLFESNPCIFVATHSFVAENVPFDNDDFVGCGQSDDYLRDFIDRLIPYIETNYRVSSGAENRTIVGADFGGLLSLYAALKHPDTFARCVALSPMLWVVKNDLLTLISESEPIEALLSYGTYEGSVMRNDVKTVANAMSARLESFSYSKHNDKSWGNQLITLYPYIIGYDEDSGDDGATMTIAKTVGEEEDTDPAEEQETDPGEDEEKDSGEEHETDPETPEPEPKTGYQLFSSLKTSENSEDSEDSEGSENPESSEDSEGSENPEDPEDIRLFPDETVEFVLIDDYQKGSQEVSAHVLVKCFPTEINSKYYWNIVKWPDNEFILSIDREINFSSTKSSDSWLRIAIMEDESVESVAVSSTGFNVRTESGLTPMTITGDHTVRAEVPFETLDKSFTIRYGGINNGNDMGDITTTQYASLKCAKAIIDYDFLTNAVSITETAWGEDIDAVVIGEFSAVPSVTVKGRDSNITIRLNEEERFDATLTSTYNYGFARSIDLTPTGENEWTANLPELEAGIHTLTLSVSRGGVAKDNVAEICIRVLDTAEMGENELTVNPYEEIEWESVNRYKANFHTHTAMSFDCSNTMSYTVDRYRTNGYRILALTDHDFNSYPWQMFDMFYSSSGARDPEMLGMLAFPAIELSKDNRNSWNEATGGKFNHHNDFFTGRKGQEFASLRESYAYTEELGGMQIINHPGQYWSIDKEYTPGEKNSPQWHADNFLTFSCLIGLEVYNQGNRRPNDRILWDQILTLTMPHRPVWGYSCDDTHSSGHFFRNYEQMLMPDLTLDNLKSAMRNGALYFSYEYAGSGNALAPNINAIHIDHQAKTITIDSDADEIRWISSTDRSDGPSTSKSTVVGIGNKFDYRGFKGNYVRALLTNDKGETCTQPFGFEASQATGVESISGSSDFSISVYPNPATENVTVHAASPLRLIEIYSLEGSRIMAEESDADNVTIDVASFPSGTYIVRASTDTATSTSKLIIR